MDKEAKTRWAGYSKFAKLIDNDITSHEFLYTSENETTFRIVISDYKPRPLEGFIV